MEILRPVYTETRLGCRPLRTAEWSVDYGCEIKLASLNVKSLLKPLMHKQVADYMAEAKVDLVCLQETNVAKVAQHVVEDVLFVTAGHGEESREHAGVAFAIGPRIRAAVTGYSLGHGGRIAALALDLRPRALTVVSVYIPQSQRPEEERVQVFDSLREIMEAAERKGPTLILGDFNARIHGRRSGEAQVLGPHIFGAGVSHLIRPERGYGEKSNRDLMVELCGGGEYLVANTWFKKRDARKVTFMPPGTKQLPGDGEPWDPRLFGEIDFCLVPSRWRNLVLDVESNTRAGLPTDHFPLEIKVRLRLRPKRGKRRRSPGGIFLRQRMSKSRRTTRR